MTQPFRYLAHYFPQFHAIDENDEAWGKGFTDWELVKTAIKHDDKQHQPRVPLNKFYYDLSNPDHVDWQIKLAIEYGLGGFNFYHYWFDGKLVLEKPLENFYENKEHDLSYCITWANDTWTRQWIGDPTILLEQKYIDDEGIWREHFNYLCKFFKDDRYIKVDSKPLLCIFRPDIHQNLEKNISFFNELAKENGFPGIFFMGMMGYKTINKEHIFNMLDANVKFQPRFLFNSGLIKKSRLGELLESVARSFPEKMQILLGRFKYMTDSTMGFDYVSFWERLIEDAKNDKTSIFQSCIVDWDNTARYKKKSKFFYNVSPDVFEQRLDDLTEVVKAKGQSFLFINAWNEWSEGAHLEPDEKHEYEYLKAIKRLSRKHR